MVVAVALGLVYGWTLLVALTNALFMRRPRGSAPCNFQVMVPARNEAERLPLLVPPLVAAGCLVTVYDDGSTDGTGDVAAALGARVIKGADQLPEGWRGKPHACHRLASEAAEEWVVFLDADTRPSPEFVERLSRFLADRPTEVHVVTGFPRMLPGAGWEPLYLFWVPWILLATNPFGLVARTGRGHNMFLNGQFTAWRRSAVLELQPFGQVKDQVLDDVMLGRFLARKGVRVEVANLSGVLSVKMYDTFHDAVQGMRKNTADVVPGRFGFIVFSIVLAGLGGVWILNPWVFFAGVLVSLLVNSVVKMPWWLALAWPVSLACGAWTSISSGVSRRRGTVTWKGRPLS